MSDGERRHVGFDLVHRVKDHEEIGGHKMHCIDIKFGGWPVGSKRIDYYNFDPDKVPLDLAYEKAFEMLCQKLRSVLATETRTLKPVVV